MDRATHAMRFDGSSEPGRPHAPLLPRLELPTFTLAPRRGIATASRSVAAPAQSFPASLAPPAPARAHVRAHVREHAQAPIQQHHARIQHHAPAQQFAPAQHQVPVQHHAPVHHVAPAQHRVFEPERAASFATAPSVLQPAGMADFGSGRSIRDAITPMHLGLLATLCVVALLIAQGPAASRAMVPAKLPIGSSVVAGGGAFGAASNDAGVTPPKQGAPGMPSPAAAASIAAERTGAPAQSPESGPIRFTNIPSPAAAATMAPDVLPLKRSRSMSLPYASGERDTHAVDAYYGGGSTVRGGGAAEPMPTRPVMTPAQAAEFSQTQATQQRLASAGSQPADPNSGF
jgi:hypothetical protein